MTLRSKCLASIVIPTINEFKNLKPLLDSLVLQKKIDFSTFEINIISNNQNNSFKGDFNKNFIKYKKLKINFFYETRLGLMYARHKGISNSSSEIIILLDDDVTLTEYYIHNVMKEFDENKKICVMGGQSILTKNIVLPKWIKRFFFEINSKNKKICTYLSFLYLGKKKIVIDPKYIFGLNMCFRKSIYYKLAGFHPDLIGKNDDNIFIGDGETGFLLKIKKKNLLAIYNPKLKVYHRIEKSRLKFDYFLSRSRYKGYNFSFTRLKNNPRILGALSYFFVVIMILLKNIFLFYYFKYFKKDITRFKYKILPNIFFFKSVVIHHFNYLFNKELRLWVSKPNYFN
jgi:glycosyltransferase involved in cell wall biosynthesis